MLAGLNTVEAHNGKLRRHLNARACGSAHQADGQQVVAADHCGQRVRALQARPQLLKVGARVARHLNQRKGFQSGLLHGVAVAEEALLSAIGLPDRPGHHADMAVAQRQQVSGGFGHRAAVIDAYARPADALRHVVRQHEGHLRGGQLRQHGAAVRVGYRQHQPGDALTQHMLDNRRLAFGLIVAGGHQQPETGQPRLALHRL